MWEPRRLTNLWASRHSTFLLYWVTEFVVYTTISRLYIKRTESCTDVLHDLACTAPSLRNQSYAAMLPVPWMLCVYLVTYSPNHLTIESPLQTLDHIVCNWYCWHMRMMDHVIIPLSPRKHNWDLLETKNKTTEKRHNEKWRKRMKNSEWFR
jgi:hypothetical protein